jgi:hypothetical protein
MNQTIKVPNVKTLMMYRRMLKTMMVVFKNDYEMFHRGRIEVRKSIEATAHERDLQKINELLF